MEAERGRRIEARLGILLIAALIPMILSGAWAVSLGRDASWDLRNYHFYNGYAFLHKPAGYDFAPAQVQSFFNPLLHVPVFWMLRNWTPLATTFALGALQGLNAALLFRLAWCLFPSLSRRGRILWSALLALAGFCGAANLSELGTSFSDNILSIVILLAVHLLLCRGGKASGLPIPGGRLLGIGILIGGATGLKPTLMIYAVAFALAALVVLVGHGSFFRSGLSRSLLLLLGLTIGFAASYGTWGMHLWREYGNPVYPYFNQVFRSEEYPLENPADRRFLPRDTAQALFYPFYFIRSNSWVTEHPFRDLRLAAAYLLIVLLLARGAAELRTPAGRSRLRSSLRTERGRALLFLFLFFGIAYVMWQSWFSIYRYAVTLELLTPLLCALALAVLIPARRWAQVSTVTLLVLFLAWVQPPDFGREAHATTLLRIQVPPIDHLEDSLVLMAGLEASSYIIPSFPPTTRFLRIEANFMHRLDRRAPLEGRIRSILSAYPGARRLAYVAEGEEETIRQALRFYGLGIDPEACVELRSSTRLHGRLCSVSGPRRMLAGENNRMVPVFEEADPDFRVEVAPAEVVAGRDFLTLQVHALEAPAVDLLYSLNGTIMPVVRSWPLDEQGRARVFVSESTPRGRYRYLAIRDARAGPAESWLQIDIEVIVK